MNVLSCFVQLKSVLFNLLCVLVFFFRTLAVSSVSDCVFVSKLVYMNCLWVVMMSTFVYTWFGGIYFAQFPFIKCVHVWLIRPIFFWTMMSFSFLIFSKIKWWIRAINCRKKSDNKMSLFREEKVFLLLFLDSPVLMITSYLSPYLAPSYSVLITAL